MDLKNIEFIEKNKPAIDEDIHLVNNQIKGILPDVYKEFLKITNGAVLNEYVFYSTKIPASYLHLILKCGKMKCIYCKTK